tara:strand:+ start:1594 stop:1827 length:234 start_codon:yes stop_codon:yes gene_type:complete
MSKDDMIELYVNTVNKIINDKVEGDLDSHIWISLVARKDILEQVLGIAPKKSKATLAIVDKNPNNIKINGEEYVSED